MRTNGHPSRYVRALFVFCVVVCLCTWNSIAESEKRPLSKIVGDERNRGNTMEQLVKENAKLKRVLREAEVKIANLRTEISVYEHREKKDRETGNRVLLALAIIVGIGLLIRFTRPRS